MKSFVPLVVSLASVAIASITTRAGCNHDNCYRAVAATNPPGHLSTASSDCSTFLQTTFTPPPNVITVTVTTFISSPSGIQKRQTGDATVPAYAVGCTNVAKYSSACSCLGITQATITAATPTSTTTTTVTATPTCTANLNSDPNNCGACGYVCPPGESCHNGSCSASECAGSTCDSGFLNCGSNEDCFCFSDASGRGFCGQNAVCDTLTACTTNADCGVGSGDICAVETCCASEILGINGVCLSPLCENPNMKLVRMGAVGSDALMAARK